MRQHSEQSRFGVRQALGRLAQVGPRRRFDTFDSATEGRVIEIQRQYLAFGKMRFQLQRAEDLFALSPQRARMRIKDARYLHGQGGTTGHRAAIPQNLSDGARQGQRIYAGMTVKPTVLVREQCVEVQRRHVLGRDGIAPDVVGVGERTQRCAVTCEHDRTAAVLIGQRQREDAVEGNSDRRQRQQHRT